MTTASLKASDRSTNHYPHGAIMLVIARRRDEVIWIGPADAPIGCITIVNIKRDGVRIGLDFPRSIEIHKHISAEALDSFTKIQSEGKKDAKINTTDKGARG
ncbi:MAG: hypothetical protein COA96_16840 [SAR86 cluster bacterium]|uniref:Carbon storage regulator n=1 Tax=SAR86 cluster bacterium TaxID=2030880 RepID=A0A2A5AHK1_9GAMM|nr:MAG: hypothetical protein COA96_16840 [SAR86 cluster bacterium]